MSGDLEDAIRAFERHLRVERGLAANTVRAYLGDLASLTEHLLDVGVDRVELIDVGVLRDWLGEQHDTGQVLGDPGPANGLHPQLHRRSAIGPGWLAADPGLLLGTARAKRTLPKVLDQAEAVRMLDFGRPGSGSRGGGAASSPDASLRDRRPRGAGGSAKTSMRAPGPGETRLSVTFESEGPFRDPQRRIQAAGPRLSGLVLPTLRVSDPGHADRV